MINKISLLLFVALIATTTQTHVKQTYSVQEIRQMPVGILLGFGVDSRTLEVHIRIQSHMLQPGNYSLFVCDNHNGSFIHLDVMDIEWTQQNLAADPPMDLYGILSAVPPFFAIVGKVSDACAKGTVRIISSRVVQMVFVQETITALPVGIEGVTIDQRLNSTHGSIMMTVQIPKAGDYMLLKKVNEVFVTFTAFSSPPYTAGEVFQGEFELESTTTPGLSTVVAVCFSEGGQPIRSRYVNVTI